MATKDQLFNKNVADCSELQGAGGGQGVSTRARRCGGDNSLAASPSPLGLSGSVVDC